MQENVSTFGQSAVALDADFAELERLGGQIDRNDLDASNGLERAQQLLTRFGETALRVADGVQLLAKNLDEARQRAELTSQIVANRALAIQERQKESARLFERFRMLSDTVRGMTAQIGELRGVSPAQISERLPELDQKFSTLADEARSLQVDAGNSKLKVLEKSAESLSQSLAAARKKMSAFVQPQV